MNMIRFILSIMIAIPAIVSCLSVAGKNMEGSKRRILRAIKSRLKNENKLLTLQLTLPVTEQFYINLEVLNHSSLIHIISHLLTYSLTHLPTYSFTHLLTYLFPL